MKVLVALVACLGLSLGAPSSNKQHVPEEELEAFDYEYVNQPLTAQYVDSSPSATQSHGGHGNGHTPGKVGYSAGGGLVSIAQGAAEQAHTAILNQHTAAGQAAYQAKNTLAQSAAQSAATAAAALAGKQIIVMGLEQQSRDAHLAVDGEKMQLQQAQRAATASQNTAQQAMHQVQVITAALNAAQATADHAAQAAAEAAAELAAQTTMVGQAKARAETIDDQLAVSRIDFEATQAAANKAAAAAQTAQNNAAAAAAHAASAAAAVASGHHPASLHHSPPPAPHSAETYEYKSGYLRY
ncbi:antifreeze protein Maxi-like [Orussus abietinus]|uniref:antifreeze protein Maxi-like n=1 Tax=Orussus abietinus TaxID=222816 RepID=UPI0006266A8F|nr:antifreeze protein Maxi-like [Orussus abietinus]